MDYAEQLQQSQRALEHIMAYVRRSNEACADEPTELSCWWDEGQYHAAVIWLHHDGPIEGAAASGPGIAEALIALAEQLPAHT